MRTGRVTVITGAAGGIGSALVQRFLDNDDTVIATDTSPQGLEDLAHRYDGRKLSTCVADVSRADDCQAVIDTARRKDGRIDVLLNVAGFFPTVAFEDMTLDQWRRVIDVNLTGQFLMIKAVLPLMTRSLAMAPGGYGITVNAVTPGLTLTPPIRDNFPADMVHAQRDVRAIPRDETADDLVGPTFFLVSPDADFLSGQTVNVDGGKHKL